MCEAPPAPPPPPTARGFTYGDTTGSDESGGGSNQIIAVPIAIPTDGVLVGIGFIATQTSGQHLYLGLYADAGGQPGALVAGAPGELAVATGTNEVVVPNTRVSAGAYWMLENCDGTTHFASDGHTVDVGISTATYGPLPAAIHGSLGTATGKAPDVFVRLLHWSDYGL